jgi:hypothetical protein
MARRRKRAAEESPVSFFSFQDIICCVTGILVLVTMILAMELVNRNSLDKPQSGPLGELRQEMVRLRGEIEVARKEQERLNKLLSTAKASILKASANAAVLPQNIPALEEGAKLAEMQAAKVKTTLAEKESLRDQLQIELLGLASSTQTDAQRIEEVKKQIAIEKSRPDVPAPGGAPSSLRPLYVEFSPSDVKIGQLSATGQPVLAQKLASYQAFLSWAGKRKTTEEFFVLMVKPDTITDFAKLRFELRKLGFQVGWDAVLPDYSFFKPTTAASEKKEAN